MTLKIWHNDSDYVIAESAEEASKILAHEWGYKSVEELRLDQPEVLEWSSLSDDTLFPFTEELMDILDVEDSAELTKDKIELGPGEVFKERGAPIPEGCTTFYTVEKDGRVLLRTRLKLPAAWVEEMGRGYFASSEY